METRESKENIYIGFIFCHFSSLIIYFVATKISILYKLSEPQMLCAQNKQLLESL